MLLQEAVQCKPSAAKHGLR